MKKIIILIFFISVSVIIAQTVNKKLIPDYKITLNIVDENCKSVERVEVSSSGITGYKNGNELGESKKSKTNKNGLVSIENKSKTKYIFIGVYSPKEFYEYNMPIPAFWFKKQDNGKLLPWNPTIEVVLKR